MSTRRPGHAHLHELAQLHARTVPGTDGLPGTLPEAAQAAAVRAEAARRTAEALATLPEPWLVLHSLPVEASRRHLAPDHLVVGPAGIVAIRLVTSADRARPDVASVAEHVAARLTAALGEDLPVDAITVRDTDNDAPHAVENLLGRPERLAGARLARVQSTARRHSTWVSSPRPDGPVRHETQELARQLAAGRRLTPPGGSIAVAVRQERYGANVPRRIAPHERVRLPVPAHRGPDGLSRQWALARYEVVGVVLVCAVVAALALLLAPVLTTTPAGSPGAPGQTEPITSETAGSGGG
ncbi:MAG: NERD domain-containing protein [Actinomycetota bacterium]|nr:MAG: NERD domain-containing protein [Actinomycetota bacterium]